MPCVWQSESNIVKMRNSMIPWRRGKNVYARQLETQMVHLMTWKVSSVWGAMVMEFKFSKKVSVLRKKCIEIVGGWSLTKVTKGGHSQSPSER